MSSTPFDPRKSAETVRRWRTPDGWTTIDIIDAHTAGEPLRVIVSGVAMPPGKTVLDRRRWARTHLDRLRTALMWEPRGHADMYGCLLMPPVRADSDFAVLFMHNDGWSTMCGHGIIAVVTVAIDAGLIDADEEETRVRIDTPAGLIEAVARVVNGRTASVRFRNVPSFVVALERQIFVPGVGDVTYDLAFGGAFYAYVDAAALGLRCTAEFSRDLIDVGRSIKRAIAGSEAIVHPAEEDLGFLYGTIFVAPAESGAHSRHVCIFADGELDRSPTGTGVSGRLAILASRKELGLEQPVAIESILGTRFTGRIVGNAVCGPYAAVLPEVEGSAFITGRQTVVIDPGDPLQGGFLLR